MSAPELNSCRNKKIGWTYATVLLAVLVVFGVVTLV